MNAFDILIAAQFAGGKLSELLDAIAAQYPDAAPALADLKSKFEAPLSSGNIAALSGAVIPELLDIAHGKINPRNHPSDLA